MANQPRLHASSTVSIKTRGGHIITLEEPIEFLYRNEKSIVSQREVELDTLDYVTCAARQSAAGA